MEFGGYLRFLMALVFVIGMIWLLALAAKRMGFGFPATAFKGGRNKRLSVVEVTPLDGRRRLVLLRRDDTEHLIILSPTRETVIETGIQARGSHHEPPHDRESHHEPPHDNPGGDKS